MERLEPLKARLDLLRLQIRLLHNFPVFFISDPIQWQVFMRLSPRRAGSPMCCCR